MARWEQVGGDVNPKEYGAVLARIDGSSIEVVSIDPDDDKPGSYIVTSNSFDKDDLDYKDNKDVARSIGVSERQWNEQGLAGRAQAKHEYHGSMWGGDTRIVHGWAKALPAASNSIKWWR